MMLLLMKLFEFTCFKKLHRLKCIFYPLSFNQDSVLVIYHIKDSFWSFIFAKLYKFFLLLSRSVVDI